MEDRKYRKKWHNPFAGSAKKTLRSCQPIFTGFLRCVPLHRWSFHQIAVVLNYVATRPARFGFPDAPACVINTMSFLPSIRSRNAGVSTFGVNRGCKIIVVPPSATGLPFDKLDAQLILPVFAKNPSVEILFLSKDCQPMVPELVATLGKCRNLSKLILPDWNDAKILKQLVVACKYVEHIDVVCPDDSHKNWNDEASVQCCCEMIEMHPKLKSLEGSKEYLATFYQATKFSRCKHNVALLQGACLYTVTIWFIWFFAVCIFWYLMSLVEFELISHSNWGKTSRDLSWMFTVVAGTVATVLMDYFGHPTRGRSWAWWVKYGIVVCKKIRP